MHEVIVRLKIIVRVEIRRAVRVGADGRWLLEEIAISQCRGRSDLRRKVDVLLVAVVSVKFEATGAPLWLQMTCSFPCRS